MLGDEGDLAQGPLFHVANLRDSSMKDLCRMLESCSLDKGQWNSKQVVKVLGLLPTRNKFFHAKVPTAYAAKLGF